MFEQATVTIPYLEFEKIVNECKKYKEKFNKMKSIKDMTDEEFEADPFKKGLDEIFDLLEKASKFTTAKEKQYFIYKSMKAYCNIFKIPINELLEDISKGTEPKKVS